MKKTTFVLLQKVFVCFCDMAAVGFFEWAEGGEASEREIDIGGK